MPIPTNLHPAVAESLELWHKMIATNDMSKLSSIIHPEAVFRSPMAYTAYTPAEAVILVLTTVIQVFQDFKYHRQFGSDDGLNVVLEFSARVGDKNLKGVDLIKFDENGQIVEFEVMVRPMSGLEALGGEMAKRLKHKLPEFKSKM